MATIKALDRHAVHQIQSGQVIVDLCSVVKELVENSLDAGATSIEIRFKNNGWDSIEVQDNGSGIVRENYDTIALKHYTSKLSSHDDLSSLQTFGFRGEALSSLCALSKFHVTTACAGEAPKGTKLDFEASGKLKSTSVVASQKGTTVAVENLFMNLPVRRRELEKNIKREYGKVLGILQAYACISTQARISVSNVVAKGKKVVVFATKSNQTTRENIASVFGAKALPALATMNLNFELQSTRIKHSALSPENKPVQILGHISRPVFGEGRQAPDRQMFFVNSRPCGLPQVAKVFNEVYKSYNVSQSPFIFANILIDTDAYDVNVSPDKRMILLHDQTILLDSIKASLITLLDEQDQTVPESQNPGQRLAFQKYMVFQRSSSVDDGDAPIRDPSLVSSNKLSDDSEDATLSATEESAQYGELPSLIESFASRDGRERNIKAVSAPAVLHGMQCLLKNKQTFVKGLEVEKQHPYGPDGNERDRNLANVNPALNNITRPLEDFNRRIAEQQPDPAETVTRSMNHHAHAELREPSQEETKRGECFSGVVQNAFDRMRPRRSRSEVASIMIGSKTTTSILGPSSSRWQRLESTPIIPPRSTDLADDTARQEFSSSIRAFAAPASGLIKTVGKVRSKSRVSPSYSSRASDEEQELRVTDLSPEISTPSEDDEGNPAESLARRANKQLSSSPINADLNDDYVDDQDKKAREEVTVAQLIKQAEEKAVMPTQDNVRRADQILKGRGQKDSPTQLIQRIDDSIGRIDQRLQTLETLLQASGKSSFSPNLAASMKDTSAEESLSLNVSKIDFADMHITGQFNLGFILAVRAPSSFSPHSDLFIIDQHASDEKYNFERLQANTVVQHQPLVHPCKLNLTAIEEETVLDNTEALLMNGFQVEIDTSGDKKVGHRCQLISLPMSREITFDVTDLEELIALLAESPSSSSPESVPRPTKVRRMFAMRACRSSVMIGKTLTLKQMGALVRKMGEIERPWNCPHGRPTMRHVCGLQKWEGWKEGGGLAGTWKVREESAWSTWIESVKNREAVEHEEMDGKEGQMEGWRPNEVE